MSDNDSILSYESSGYTEDTEEEYRDWDALLGTDGKNVLLEWLAERCPAELGLHDCRLDPGAWDNTKGKTYEERQEAYQKRRLASSKNVHTLFQQKFAGTELLEKFMAIEKKEDEEGDWEVLEDFWIDLRTGWMYVANGDAREILRPLKDGQEILVMAEIHRKIALSPINMTEIVSAIRQVENPDIYGIGRAVDEINESGRPTEDDAMMWNYPAANSVLKYLAKCYEVRE